jgi:hypothetical protein
MPLQLRPERVEILGLNALTWLAGQPEAFTLFLRLSGISAADLKEAAGSPGLTLALVDFLLTHEAFLLAFCEAEGTRAAELHLVRHTLAPEN